jgi:hypothetical protein
MTLDQRKHTRPLGWLTIFVLGVVLVTVLLTPLKQYIQAFASGKPGLWGTPAWYVVLLLAYGTLGLAALAHVGWSAFKTTHRDTYRRHALLLVGLTLVRGLLYSSIAPPWQSPDEHAHFEYAALLGQLKRVPTLNDLSPDLQRRIAASMFDYDFWRLIKREPVTSPPVGFLPQSGITQDPPTHVIDNRFLYYPQVEDDPPLYYVAPALAYALFPHPDVTWQLYVMRLTTVLMLVALIGVILWATRRLFPNDVWLALTIPTLIAWHPMLAHIGSVLNNDILAAVITALLLGVLVITTRSGLDWRRGLAIAGLVVLGLLTKKSTVWTIPLIGSVGLAWGSRRSVWVRRATWITGAGTAVLLVSLFIPSRQARYWVPLSSPWGDTVARTASPDGTHALHVAGGTSENGMLGQRLVSQTALDLRGHPIALSAHVRADSENTQGALALVDLDHGTEAQVDFAAGPEWQEVTIQFAVPDDTMQLQIVLISAPQSVVYFDQITITDLSAPENAAEWLRNGSGERIRTLGEIAVVGISDRLGFGGVVQRFFNLWQDNLRRLWTDPWPIQMAFESFWGNFGAALVVPMSPTTYRILGLACGLGTLGIGVTIWNAVVAHKRTYQAWQQRALLVLGAALVFALLQVFVPILALYGFWSVQGRYLFPVIWPISVFLTLGWAELVSQRGRPWLALGGTIGIIVLDGIALRVMASYFYAF